MRAGVVSLTRRTRSLIMLFVPLCFSSSAETPSAETSIAVAYSSAGTLTLTTAAGKIVKIVRPKPAIGKFAISPDASLAVFIPLDAPPNGGPLYSLDISTGKARRLTTGHAYAKGEVYASPDFSPGGASIVFAIHAPVAGPVGTMNLQSRKIAILNATRNFGGLDP